VSGSTAALEFAEAGNWEDSHAIIMQHDDALSCRIHAWLHRVEGDLSNARYWYGRADIAEVTGGTDEELVELMTIARHDTA